MPYFSHNGHRLFYREEGRGALLVILHGNTASSACHAGELEYFGKRVHCAAPDFLGTGQSERVAELPKDWWKEGAGAAAALVEHLASGPALVMGPSGGGVAALLMAIHYPDKVRAVVADSCVERWTPQEVERIVEERARLSVGQIAFWKNAHGDDWDKVVSADTEMIRKWLPTGFDFFDGRLGEIACPVLLTDSLGDELLPRVGPQVSSMLAQIPDARAYLVMDGKHPMMWSRAEEFRRASDAFLASVTGA